MLLRRLSAGLRFVDRNNIRNTDMLNENVFFENAFDNLSNMRSASRYILLSLLSIIFPYIASASSSSSALLHFQRGNAYYERARFDSAALEYEAVLADSLCSDMLYYNLGNAYYRLQQYPRAILNYERALKLSPTNENADFNLALARSFTVDKLDIPEASPLTKVWNSFRNLLSAKGWAILGFLALAFSLLCVLLLRFFVTRELFRRLFFVPILTGIISATAIVLSFDVQSRNQAHNDAIILQSVVSVKGSPDASAKDLFLLHAGTKVQILQKLGEWYEISIPAGHQGWVESYILEKI